MHCLSLDVSSVGSEQLFISNLGLRQHTFHIQNRRPRVQDNPGLPTLCSLNIGSRFPPTQCPKNTPHNTGTDCFIFPDFLLRITITGIRPTRACCRLRFLCSRPFLRCLVALDFCQFLGRGCCFLFQTSLIWAVCDYTGFSNP